MKWLSSVPLGAWNAKCKIIETADENVFESCNNICIHSILSSETNYTVSPQFYKLASVSTVWWKNYSVVAGKLTTTIVMLYGKNVSRR